MGGGVRGDVSIVPNHKVWVLHSHHSTGPQDLNGQLDQMEQKNQHTEEQLNTLREELVGVREVWGEGTRCSIV